MAEQLQGGEQQKSFEDQFLEHVRCTYNPEERLDLPEETRSLLQPYFEAQDAWRDASYNAARAEEQYQELVGRPSSKPLPDNPNPRYVFTGDSGVIEWPDEETGMFSKPSGYGRTKAGLAAYAAEQSLTEVAEKVADTISRSKKVSSVDKLLWNSLLHESYPVNPAIRDVVAYALEAQNMLIEISGHTVEPIVIIRRRQPGSKDWLNGNKDDPIEKSYSDLLSAERFSLNVAENGLRLVLEKGIRIQFEDFGSTSYGGRAGLIGSAQFEDIWSSVNSPVAQEYDKFDTRSVFAMTEIRRTAEESFPTLRQLAYPRRESFWDILRFPTYVHGGMSGRGDNRTEGEAASVIFTGKAAGETLFTIPPKEDKPSINSRRFESALRRALETYRVASLQRGLGKAAIDPFEYYS